MSPPGLCTSEPSRSVLFHVADDVLWNAFFWVTQGWHWIFVGIVTATVLWAGVSVSLSRLTLQVPPSPSLPEWGSHLRRLNSIKCSIILCGMSMINVWKTNPILVHLFDVIQYKSKKYVSDWEFLFKTEFTFMFTKNKHGQRALFSLKN